MIGEIDDLAPRAVLLLGREVEHPLPDRFPGLGRQRLLHHPARQVLLRAGLHHGLVVLQLPCELVTHFAGHEALARGRAPLRLPLPGAAQRVGFGGQPRVLA